MAHLLALSEWQSGRTYMRNGLLGKGLGSAPPVELDPTIPCREASVEWLDPAHAQSTVRARLDLEAIPRADLWVSLDADAVKRRHAEESGKLSSLSMNLNRR